MFLFCGEQNILCLNFYNTLRVRSRCVAVDHLAQSSACFLGNFEPHIADLAHSVLKLLMLTYLKVAILDLYVKMICYYCV